MTTREHGPVHPGAYIRENVIPRGMTVTEAAKRLGIGRPALSNLLNGKSALSAQMAVRLEKAFGADRSVLLEMQATYDQKGRRTVESEVAVGPFVPNFLTIKARQVEAWAESNINARTHLPVLLRKLVHSTGRDLLLVDFPGYDNAQRKGSDGLVEAGAATPWIAKGKSHWEFGTDKDPGRKADKDYAARLKSVGISERTSSTFVFVTPRNWPGKVAWEKQKNEAGDWMAVRAFDASDLEQWLEQSVPAQIWLAEQFGLPASGYETLEGAWRRWANATEPPLTPELFAPSVATYGAKLKKWLEEPGDVPFVVAADSQIEALAFLACLFEQEELRHFKDVTAVFTGPDTLRTLLASSVAFIPIVHSEETERELANANRRLHCIVFRPRNAPDTEPNIALDLLGYEALQKALTAMGFGEHYVARLARESGHSPTILRRRLSRIPAIKSPVWAEDNDKANALVPMALVGAWHAESEADREIVARVAAKEYETIEREVAGLLQADDSPVWSAGRHRGVVSKIDALFAVAKMFTPADLDRFFIAAEYVLSESDPALDLPERDRWAAALYGKTRNHSGALRKGICETLVILAVHGNNLFRSRLGVDVESSVAILIRKLLTPLTLEKLLSQDHDLPRYAEAAPEEFLKIVEEDLRADDPVVYGLLKPVESAFFGASPSRTGLLWALECLAWKPNNLPRVSAILARLSKLKISDNWSNKPVASLHMIFSSWMPQTAASVEERVRALKLLTKRFPDVVWEVCIEQVKPGSRIGHYSYRPLWRNDASGAGQVATYREIHEFNREALKLLIEWPAHDEKTLGDLIENLEGSGDEGQAKIWALVNQWSENATDTDKASLRERIRQFVFTRRGRYRKLGEATRDRARQVYESLRPVDTVIRHSWLFADQWVQESADEIEDDHLDFEKRAERVDTLRRTAMIEIWTERGFEGIWQLLTGSNAPDIVGRYASSCVAAVQDRADFVGRCLSLDGDLRPKAEWFLRGFLLAIEEDSSRAVLRAAAETLPDEERTRLFVCSPFRGSTWRLLDDYGEDIRRGYWKSVSPSWGRYTPAELTELIDRLLEAKRPRAAFHAVHLHFKDIETSRLQRLLRDVATINAEPADQFPLESYYVSEALDSLDGRAGVSRDEMAQLEFLFMAVLDDSEHGIRNLERQIAQSPALFVQAVAFAFKRSDDELDPPELRIENPDQQERAAAAGYRLLNQIRAIPGTDEQGKIGTQALTTWITEVRRLCREYARVDIGDQMLGQLLANAPADENGMWPCEAVCEAMEQAASPQIGRGFSIGVRNSRGAHWRRPGGEQERELAAKYHSWAERLNFDYPFVGGVLEEIAASYEREAEWEDSEATIEKRIRY